MATFAQRSVLLTGASVGIGRELALLLAAQGAHLVLAARDVVKLDEVAVRCRALGGKALVVPTDVGIETDCARLVEAAVAAFGSLDMILLNAGQDMWARLDELEDAAVLERVMRINYLGPAWLTRLALPHLAASRGRIVVVRVSPA
jgi:NAD(P)-dependent dehydrogenase (short-subunit alcohol dehydrogenase family)